ncbi:MAG: hypothetical protein U0414_10050 [Polyangiaceae bacterium]
MWGTPRSSGPSASSTIGTVLASVTDETTANASVALTRLSRSTIQVRARGAMIESHARRTASSGANTA